MDFSSIAVVVLAAVAFLVAYKFKAPAPLPDRKPSLCLLPKFKGTMVVPPGISQAADPAEALGRALSEFGFSEATRKGREIVFARGSAIGDFSIRIAKVNFRVSLPIESSATFSIEYGSFAAFDTGDLWQFAQELTRSIGPAA